MINGAPEQFSTVDFNATKLSRKPTTCDSLATSSQTTGDKPVTLSGLALHLGFTSRQSLINYKHKNKAFLDTISKAKLRCEDYTESRLYDRDGQRGAEFSLRCNFGWNDKVQDDGDTEKLDAILGAIKSEANKA